MNCHLLEALADLKAMIQEDERIKKLKIREEEALKDPNVQALIEKFNGALERKDDREALAVKEELDSTKAYRAYIEASSKVRELYMVLDDLIIGPYRAGGVIK